MLGDDDDQNHDGLFPYGDDFLTWEGGHFANTSYQKAELCARFRDV